MWIVCENIRYDSVTFILGHRNKDYVVSYSGFRIWFYFLEMITHLNYLGQSPEQFRLQKVMKKLNLDLGYTLALYTESRTPI